jgi:hypothetical protein
MAKGQVRSNREAKKPKKEKPKVAESAPSLMKIATPRRAASPIRGLSARAVLRLIARSYVVGRT